MTDYYYDDGGSNTSPYDTMAKAANAFSTVVALAGSGDRIFCGHDNKESIDGNAVYQIADGVEVYSVNSTTEAYQKGSEIELYGASSRVLRIPDGQSNRNFTINGMVFKRTGQFEMEGGGGIHKYVDCTIEGTDAGGGRIIRLDDIDTTVYLIDTELNFGGSGDYIGGESGGRLFMRNVSTTGTAVNALLEVANGNPDGFEFDAENTDLGGLIASSGTLVLGTPSGLIGHFGARLYRCSLPSGFSVGNITSLQNYNVDITACNNGTGYHYFEHHRREGSIYEDTDVYLNATYDGTNGFSAKLETSTLANAGNVLKHKLMTKPAYDFSADETLTVEFCQTSNTSAPDNLTDTEFFIEIVYNDDTDHTLGEVDNSSRNSDILAAGSDHTDTDTGTWTDNTTYITEQKVAVDMTGFSNVTNGTLTVYACLAKPSTTVFVDPAITVS